MREIFENCGRIKYVRCLQHKVNKVDKGCKGVAYVCFESPDAVGLAIELKGTMLNDRPINVERFSQMKLDMIAKQKALQSQSVAKNNGQKSILKVNGGTASTTISDGEMKKSKKKFAGIKISPGKSKNKLNTKKKKKQANELTKMAKKIAPFPKLIEN